MLSEKNQFSVPAAKACSPQSPTRLLRLAQVLERIPVCKATWWAGVKTGVYPAATKLSVRTTVWHSCDIDDLIERTRKGGAA